MPTRGAVLAFRPSASADTEFVGASRTGGPDTTAPFVTITSTGSSRPAQIFPLQDLGAGRCFIHPMYVVVDSMGDEFHAVAADLAMVGRGESEFDALDDLRVQVAELYDSLSEMKDRLGPHLRSQLAFLDRLAGIR